MLDNLKSKLNNLNNKQKIIIAVLGFAIIVILFAFLYKAFYTDDEDVIFEQNEQENESELQETDENQNSRLGILQEKKTVTVHIVGEVNSPGVVTLEEGARIIDAINAAGGKTEDADLSKINLAYIIEDGIQIYVPNYNETSKIGENDEEKQIQYVKDGPGEGIIVTAEAQDNEEEKNTLVNINTANLEKLQTLPGVGQSTAQKIIEYREQNGNFKNIEELKNVSGIGESKYNNIKDKITV